MLRRLQSWRTEGQGGYVAAACGAESAPMKRSGFITRKAPMRHGRRKSAYARRDRNFVFMGFVKTLLCSVEEEWPNKEQRPTDCEGVIEADHMGQHGLGQKCPDNETAPMCSGHHRERTDHTGTFKHIDMETERGWRSRAIARTQTLYAERNGEIAW
jgi:hypothetical protein